MPSSSSGRISCTAQQNLVLQSLEPADQPGQATLQLDQRAAQPAAEPGRLHPRRSRRSASSGRNKPVRQPRCPAFRRPLNGNQTTTVPDLTAALKNSQVLSVTPLPYSKKKTLVTYGGVGLLAGLAVGLTIVIIRALVSDRLRRRDDIAYALDAPVKLSVRTLGARRRLTPVLAGPPSETVTCGGSSRTCTAPCQEVPRARRAWPSSPWTTRRLWRRPSRRWPRPTPARALRSLRLIFPAALTWRTCRGSRDPESTRSAVTA